jgi:hypothetical protein
VLLVVQENPKSEYRNPKQRQNRRCAEIRNPDIETRNKGKTDAALKSEIQISKFETKAKQTLREIRNSKLTIRQTVTLEIGNANSNLKLLKTLVSNFDIRISNFLLHSPE